MIVGTGLATLLADCSVSVWQIWLIMLLARITYMFSAQQSRVFTKR